jgi:hypothetical protein
MTLNKIALSLAVAASLVGFVSAADAAPIAASRGAINLSSTDGRIMQDVTRVVVVRRAAVRRPVARRRVVR